MKSKSAKLMMFTWSVIRKRSSPMRPPSRWKMISWSPMLEELAQYQISVSSHLEAPTAV